MYYHSFAIKIFSVFFNKKGNFIILAEISKKFQKKKVITSKYIEIIIHRLSSKIFMKIWLIKTKSLIEKERDFLKLKHLFYLKQTNIHKKKEESIKEID